MLNQMGKPLGYDQVAPGRESPKPLGDPSSDGGIQSPLQTAVGGPSQYPADGSMTSWLRGSKQGQKLQPQVQPQQQLQPGAPTNAFGNLTDPSTWMGLVGDPTQLKSWVHQQAPGLSDSLGTYYVQKIQGQPGANATEQAGSAQYWANKIQNDPTLGGGATQGAPFMPLMNAITNNGQQQQSSSLNPLILQLLQQATPQ